MQARDRRPAETSPHRTHVQSVPRPGRSRVRRHPRGGPEAQQTSQRLAPANDNGTETTTTRKLAVATFDPEYRNDDEVWQIVRQLNYLNISLEVSISCLEGGIINDAIPRRSRKMNKRPPASRSHARRRCPAYRNERKQRKQCH